MPVTATRLHISKRKRLLMLDSQAWPERTAPGTTSVALLVTAFSGEHLANLPARLVFKPTDSKVGRDTGIPETAQLESPDEAILATMFEGKTLVTITKPDPKQIYEQVFF